MQPQPPPVGDGWTAKKTFGFGPFDIAAQQEVIDDCVQITLGNAEDIYVTEIDLDTGAGFHHSNWLFTPLNDFYPAGTTPPSATDDAASAALDGTFKCRDRNFDQASAGIFGNVLFAQSTQQAHQVTQFPTGAAVKIPAHSKLMSTIHLLNPGDNPITLTPTISLVPIPKARVTTPLIAMAFENHALGLPPNAQSSFTVDCDLQPTWQNLYAIGQVPTPTPSFKIYYALAHYHAMGTGMQIEAVQADDATSSMIFQTTAAIGDSLGGALAPQFDMTGFTRIRFTCDYYNPSANTVAWGNGSAEMCVFLAFSDATYKWAGGEIADELPPNPPTIVNGVSKYSAACEVHAVDGSSS
jgi:hypothetical protein